MKIRLLFCIGSLGGGGSERQTLLMLSRIDRSRFEPLLYLMSREGELLSQVPDDVPVFSFGDEVPSTRIYWPGRVHGQQVSHLAACLRRERVDVACDRTFHATMIAGRAARRAGVAGISTIVSDPQRDLYSSERRLVGMKRRVLRTAYRRAYRVTAVSESVRQAAVAFYQLDPAKVVTAPNPVDVERVDRLSQARSSPLEPGRFHVVTVGRLGPEKGHIYLLRALDELIRRGRAASILVHIAGAGPEASRLKEYVDKRGLENRTKFWGFLENPFPLMSDADLFCLPSLYDGMPNVVLEAMACRTPVLATDCPGGVRELLDDGRFGQMAAPGSAMQLADALERAMLQPPSAEALQQAREHVERDYNVEAAVNLMEEIFCQAKAAVRT